MNDSKVYKLGDLLRIKHGYAFTGNDFSIDETPFIVVTPGNFCVGGGFKKGKLKYFKGDSPPQNYVFEPGDLIVTMTDLSQDGDTLGYAALIPDDGMTYLHNQRIGLVHSIDKNLVTKEYLYWLMRTYDYQQYVLSACTGTSIKHTSPSLIYGYQFLLPSLTKQEAIAEVLNSLEDKIQLLHKNNKTVEALAGTLFRQWFIEEADASEKETPLDIMADFLNGLALQKFPCVSGEPSLPVIKIREMNQGITDNTDVCNANIPNKYIVENGDLLFSWSGSLEVIIWTGGTGALNQHLFKVTSANYPKWLIYFALKLHLPEFRDIANDKATTMGHIQRIHLSRYGLQLPNIDTIKKHDKVISVLFDKLLNNNLQIKKLESLRNILLPKLMSGSVTIKTITDELVCS